MSKSKRWVWQYDKHEGDKGYCNFCDEDDLNEFACAGGSTGPLGGHLKCIHNLWPENVNPLDFLYRNRNCID